MKKLTTILILCLLTVLLLPFSAAAENVLKDGTLSLLAMPAGLLEIEPEAFMNDKAIQGVLLEDGLLKIGSKAFAGSGVSIIYIPGSVINIADDAFQNCSNRLNAILPFGSYAHKWCVQHSSSFDRLIFDDESDDTPSISLGNNTATISTGGEKQRYCFYPPKTGNYTLSSTGSYDTKAWLYDQYGQLLASDDDGGEGNNFALIYNLKSGQLYYYEVGFWSSTKTGSISFDLSSDVVSVPTTITEQPLDVMARYNQTVSFHVTATGSGLKYQWQEKTSDGSWADSTKDGNTTDTLSFKAYGMYDGLQVRCVVTGSDGQPVYSDTATFTFMLEIHMGTDTRIINNGGDRSRVYFVPPASGSYTLTSAGSDDTKAYLYDEAGKLLASSDDEGEHQNFKLTYSFTANRVYYYEVCYYSTTETGHIGVTLISDFRPNITQQPANVTVYSGSTASFTVKATGTGTLTYQWQERPDEYSGWNHTSLNGNKTSTLSFSASSGKQFRCLITDGDGYVKTSETATLTVQAGTAPKYRALLVGNDAYTSSPLHGCINDATAMRLMLSSLSNAFTCTQKSNLTASGMKSAISSAFSGATENDVSLFYYSGHGMESSTSSVNGALVGVNYGNSYPNDYLKTSELASALSKVPGRVIVLLDSCRSGAAIGKGIADPMAAAEAFNQSVIDAFAAYDSTVYLNSEKSGELAKSKFIVITACRGSENSSTASLTSGEGCSVFTYFFVNGCGTNYLTSDRLDTIPADNNGDSQITVSEIFNYTKTNASDFNSGQTAQYYASNQNEVLFRR